MGKKRANGEGTIYQQSTGAWTAQASLPGGRRVSRTFPTQKEARDWLRAQAKDVASGQWTSQTRVTHEWLLTSWLNDVAPNSLRAVTVDGYRYMANKWIIPEIGRIRLGSLEPVHLQALYTRLLENGLSRRTVQLVHAVIRRALNYALKQGMITSNPASRVEAPRPVRQEPKLLTPEQARVLLGSTKGERLHACWAVLLGTGMRRSEVLGLRWKDVDLTRSILQVRQTAVELSGSKMVLGEPKTAKGKRTIVLPAFVVQALEAHQTLMAAEKAGRESWNPGDLVFPSTRGTIIEGTNLSRALRQALEKAGVPRVTLHSLRHFHATQLLAAGTHPKIVQERLGHAQIGITLDIYSHALPEMQAPAAAAIGKLFEEK